MQTNSNIINKLDWLYTNCGNSVKLTNNIFSSDAWLWIDKHPTVWTVTLANDKTEHNPVPGPAYMIDICNKTGVTKGWYKTILSLHFIYDKKEQNVADNKVRSAIMDFCNTLTDEPKISFWRKIFHAIH